VAVNEVLSRLQELLFAGGRALLMAVQFNAERRSQTAPLPQWPTGPSSIIGSLQPQDRLEFLVPSFGGFHSEAKWLGMPVIGLTSEANYV
jgi:hypothetical protein